MANTKSRSKKNIDTEKIGKPKIVCVCCGNDKQSDFYVSNNDDYKYFKKIPWCKNCIDNFYLEYFTTYDDNQKAIYYLCRKINIPFSFSAFEGAKRNSEKKGWKIYQSYIKQINSLGDVNNHGVCFDDTSDGIEVAQTIIDIDTDSDYIVSEQDIKYWGKNKDAWEYEYLEEEMYRLKTDFECSDYGMEMLMRDICFINLEIEKIRQGGKGDVTKLIESRSKLMNDANLKPVQATGADKNEKLSFGIFIKKWENERPVSKTLDDEMKKYIDTYMVGHLAKMEGLTNEFVKQYDDAIKEYTIDFSALRSEEYDE